MLQSSNNVNCNQVNDESKEDESLENQIFFQFTKALVSKCVWSYLKRIKPDSNSVALRKKLAVYHNSKKEPKLSLQP